MGQERGFFMSKQHNHKRNRLEFYDYSQNGYYFVTICTKDRAIWFGNIENEKMVLSKIGVIVQRCWMEITTHFQNVTLDEYVIMPNHVHGIIIINDNDVRAANCASVRAADLRPLHSKDQSKMLLSKIIHGFKSSTTRQNN